MTNSTLNAALGGSSCAQDWRCGSSRARAAHRNSAVRPLRQGLASDFVRKEMRAALLVLLARPCASSVPTATPTPTITEHPLESHLRSGLEDQLETSWEFPPELAAKAGATQLVELGESVQHMVGNQPLECECEKVKCNCVKRCDCKLPSGPSLLQLQESLLPAAGADASADGAGAPAMLELGTGIVNQELSCDCDQVKCNCIKHCECSAAPSGM